MVLQYKYAFVLLILALCFPTQIVGWGRKKKQDAPAAGSASPQVNQDEEIPGVEPPPSSIPGLDTPFSQKIKQEQQGQPQKPEKPSSNAKAEDDNESITEEWDKYMRDFVPDDMVTFELESKQEETIKEPTTIRGAYFISYFSNEQIEFSIKDPYGITMFTKSRKESVFFVNATQPGEYQFIFNNLKGQDKKAITFSIDIHNSGQEHLKQVDLDPMERQISGMISGLREYLAETKIANRQMESRMAVFKQTHQRLYFFSIFETLAIIGASVWQIHYIKKILENRRII